MYKDQIKQLVERHVFDDGTFKTNIDGVQLFKVTKPVRCAPAVYEPSVVIILSGTKEAILEGQRHVYDENQYFCCSTSMPVEAGTPDSSPEQPLLGVYISLESKIMTELVLETESSINFLNNEKENNNQGLVLANWNEGFTESLYRLLQLLDKPNDSKILGKSRLREVYYEILKGEAGDAIRQSFGSGNGIAKAIEYLSSDLEKSFTIDDLASHIGMSRAVFHRKFKQTTNMSPIQFVKSMKLNYAAMNIAEGMTINEAAMKVGYVSFSQFSREFKRMYGQSPKEWRQSR